MGVYRLVSRAVEAYNDGTGHKKGPTISPLAGLVIFLTISFFLVVLLVISYTYGRLLPVLCMIESPETNAYVPVNAMAADEPPAYTEDDDGTRREGADEDVLLVRNKPFTSSIRQTIAHLRARAGFWSVLRGFGLLFVIGFLRNLIVGFITFGSSNILAMAGGAIIAEVLLANLHLTWVHVVISEPSPKRWWRRVPKPAFTTWRRIAPAVALVAVATQVTYILPVLILGIRSGRYADDNFEPGRKDVYATMGQLTGALIFAVILTVGLQIPAMVTMVRVASSMLPDEDETIVPFDRTFGGKVTPAIVGGEGKIDLVEAWRSFPWASRKRLLVLMLKVTGIVASVWLAYVVVLVIEVHTLLTPEAFHEIMKKMHGH